MFGVADSHKHEGGPWRDFKMWCMPVQGAGRWPPARSAKRHPAASLNHMAPSCAWRRRPSAKNPCKAFIVLTLCCPGIGFVPCSLRSPRRDTLRAGDQPRKHAQLRHATMSISRRCFRLDATKAPSGAGTDRAGFLRTAAAAVGGAGLALTSGVRSSVAAEAVATEFVDFVDSRGLFGCRVPKNFLRAERPKDKRGTVFVAGDYSKAEVLSVQVVKAFDLLTDAGLPTIGDLSKWEDLGKPAAVADLLKQRRDSDAAGGAQVESVVLPGASVDGDVLQFMLKSPIKVMRADLLEKEQGVSELYRNTYVKAIMRGDGTFLVLWAGALNTDWDQEGGAKDRLKVAADSFRLEGLVVSGVRLGAV
ncbi:unnamed protein product [Scytosiphon promiscuus]